MNDNSVDKICEKAEKLDDPTGWYKNMPLYTCVLNKGICPNPMEIYCFTKKLFKDVKGDGTTYNPVDDYRR